MPTTLRRPRAAAALAALILLAAPALLRAEGRPAETILAEINALKTPTLAPDKRNDRPAVMAYFAEMQKVQAKKAELIGELTKAAPDNKALVRLLPERWNALAMSGPDKAADVIREIDEVSARVKDDTLKREGAFLKARLSLMADRAHPEAALPAIDAFAALAPKDPRGAQLYYVVSNMTDDTAARTRIEDKLLKGYPDSPFIQSIEGARRQRSAVGKPFELAFDDAISGAKVSMAGLKGKVVVIDFWATWCGPCVAEMPTMKKLYAEYKPQGVEFIGVSLDQAKEQGGLDALKAFVAKNEITWPQYYQGNYWQSDFSSSWGVNSIPCVFIVDAEGKLHSTEARGKLESLIPELLKLKKPATPAAGTGAGGE